jgi:hypothetical protein
LWSRSSTTGELFAVRRKRALPSGRLTGMWLVTFTLTGLRLATFA